MKDTTGKGIPGKTGPVDTRPESRQCEHQVASVMEPGQKGLSGRKRGEGYQGLQ